MPPIYESEQYSQEKLQELRKSNSCAECGGRLDVFMDFDKDLAFLACADWKRTHHEGIMRVAELKGLETLNIETRRKDVVEELGKEKATKLERYEGVVSLTKTEAMEILKTIWPQAPAIEVLKAGIICHQYGLNPLMKHLALIPFKKRNKRGETIGEDWVTVMEISSTRLMAQRGHSYSYLDLTPRRMTEEEQKKINGEVDNSKIWALTILKDLKTGAEANGVGSWPADEEPYGWEKGNTKLNMAKIRSERQALDRLYPAEMPRGIEVIEGKYIEGDSTLLDEVGGEKDVPGEGDKGKRQPESAGAAKSAGVEEGAAVSPPTEEKPTPPGAPAAAVAQLPKNPVFKNWGELAQAAATLGVNPSEVFKMARVNRWEDFKDYSDAWNWVKEIVSEKAQKPKML